ncbi:MAG: CinA family protein, partial [Anaerolineae bacterium]|nr:CinA family protein [Anaerolineae bacterium]
MRRRYGNFILAEDDQTLERVVLDALAREHATLALVEMFTGGQIAARLVPLPGAREVVRRALVSLDLADVCAAVQADTQGAPIDRAAAQAVAGAARAAAGATHALAVLVDLDTGPD